MMLRVFLLFSGICFLAGDLLAQDPFARHIAPTEPLSPAEELQRFHVPPGFEVQLVAAEPEVRKPINLAFDPSGRLYVTQSVEYPFPVEGGAAGRDRVGVLEKIGPDGRAGKVSTYVEGLNIPIGVQPLPDGVIVYSIPNLYRCRDTDGDGRIDRRDVLYGKFGTDDTHGMINNLRRWVDGWVYACHGFRNTSTVKGGDGGQIEMQSGNTFRMREDGSHVEYFTHGQVNPFGMAFDPLGNLFTTDCHTLPAYLLLRGAWYPSFGKPHDGLGFGPAMMKHNHGSTGLAGIVYYAAGHFPPQYRDTLFIGNPITRRVNHDRLRRVGSGYQAIEQPDFLRCDDPWFRPVDLQLGPDGALYIADFYNRIIGHYEVPLTHPGRDRERGRIWRVVYRGTRGQKPPPAMPDLAGARADALVGRLADANLTVQRMATNLLVERADARLLEQLAGKLEGASKPAERAFGLWVLERRGHLTEALVRQLAEDVHPQPRVHVLRALAERAEWAGDDAYVAELVRGKLTDSDPVVRRVAADALGRHPEPANVAPLLKLWQTTPGTDTYLVHTARMALRDHLRVDGMYERLRPLVEEDERAAGRLAAVSLGVRTEGSGAYLLAYLRAHPHGGGRLVEYLHHAVRYVPADKLPSAVAFAQTYEAQSTDVQRDVLSALQRGLAERGRPLGREQRDWALRLAAGLMNTDDETTVRAGIELARDYRLRELHRKMLEIATSRQKFGALRPLAMEAAAAVDAPKSVETLGAILADVGEPLPLRRKAAAVLAGINTEASRGLLLAAFKTAPAPLALEMALGLSRSREGGELLLRAVAEGKASARLLQERAVENGLRGAGLPQVEKRVGELTAELPPRDARFARLIAARREGFEHARAEASQGAALFKKNCAICHRLGGEGAKIGPELDGIGNRGLERVLEDILDPSRNVDAAFRGLQVVTEDGLIISGLKLREEGQVLVLADAEGKEIRIRQSEIAQQQEMNISPMPANVADVLKPKELYHLLRFLLEQRQARPTSEGKQGE